ncbi:acetyl-CoA synthetase-like protein, partial [Delitschia confertaspora ATCC 74209]
LAAICGKNQLTYGELQTRSSEVARALYLHNVRRGDKVVVVTSRCLEMVILFHGILEAGAAYVPLDMESLSRDRVSQVIEAVNPTVVVTSGNFFDCAFPVLSYSSFHELVSARGNVVEDFEKNIASPDDLAYIIFTSGTSSTPKGVMIPRSALFNYVRQENPPFNLGVNSSDKVLSIFSPAFDACTGVIFSTLYNGGTLVIAEPETLESCLEDCTILPCTPSILRSLGSPRRYEKLQAIFLGGEAPTEDLVSTWATPQRAIYNCYGPSETTCASLMSKLVPREPIVLGRPMRDSEILLISDGKENDQGEIWISGPGLAVGYLNNPTLTRSKFVRYGTTRFYRTGDYARRKDGHLFFLGRLDSMVKNRGFLINLESEVVPAIMAQAGVKSAVAIHTQDSLHAFVAPSTCSQLELRRTMLEKFDSFLVPDHIHVLDSLPMNQNGKVDINTLRGMIPIYDDIRATISVDLNTPLAILKSVVAETLHIFPNSVHDDATFWSLGGNSINAITVLARLRQYNLSVPITSLLGEDTVLHLSSSLIPRGFQTQLSVRSTSNVASPLSDIQMKMLSTISTTPMQYYILLDIELPSPLSDIQESRYQAAWEFIYRRHSILTASFDTKTESTQLNALWELDWKSSLVCKAEWVLEYRKQKNTLFDSMETFDPQNPPSAFRLITASGHKSHLLWLVHHSRIDGVSVAVLLEELQMVLDGKPLPQTVQWNEAATVRQGLQQKPPRGAQSFWLSKLEMQKQTKALDFPKPQPVVGKFEREHEVSVTSGLFTSDIDAQCQSHGISLGSIIYGAWARLLSFYTGVNTTSFGVVFSGRNLPVRLAERIVGPMINVNPFVIESMGNHTTTASWLRDIRSQILAMADFQWNFPNNSRSAREPLFDTLVSLQYNILEPEWQCKLFPGPWKIHETQLSEFTWTLLVEKQDRELRFRLLYQPTIVTSSITMKALRHFRKIFVDLCHALGTITSPQKISVPLSLAESSSLLQQDQPSALLPSTHTSLKAAFEITARQYPTLVAVEHTSGSMTYADLDASANTLSWDLFSKVVKGSKVAILADGSLNWLIAILAVVKVGAIFYPIDIKLPEERIRKMVESTDATVIVTPDETAKHLIPPQMKFHVISVKESLSSSRRLDVIPNHTGLDDPAYLIFTSGTTGIPKGVLATNKGLLSYISYPPARLHAAPGCRIAQMFSVGFDACMAEIFGTLCYGATLLLKHPGDIFAALKTANAAMMTPSLLSVFKPAKIPNLETIVLGGETVSQQLADIWSEGRRLYNGYGPCECTVGAVFRQLLPKVPVTIGRPIPGMRVYILHNDLSLAPIGVPGQIFLSGHQVVHGYFIGGTENNNKFQPDPWYPGMTMYCTGDIGYWTENFEIQFMGRRDRQVKLRGYRINLQEIESVIQKSNASISQVGVIVKNENLVAILAPRVLDLESIRQQVCQTLPSYAIPATFHTLETLPLTTNQKIDLRALEKIHLADSHPLERTPLPPGLFSEVAEIWKDILQLSNHTIQPHDDFVALGGHSIHQLRLMQRLSDHCDFKIPLDVVARHPVLSDQIRAVQLSIDSADKKRSRLEKFISQTPEVVSSVEEATIFLSTHASTTTAFNMPCLLKVNGALDLNRFIHAIQHTMNSNRLLRSRFRYTGKKIERKISDSVSVVNIQSGKHPTTEDFKRLINTAFDFSKNQLLRLTLYLTDEGVIYMFLVVHHSIMDGTSLQIFLQLLQDHYNQPMPLSQREHVSSNSRYDLIEHLNSHLESSIPEDTFAFWKRYLLSPPSPLLRPKTSSRLDNTAGYLNSSLPLHLSKHIRAICARYNSTPLELILATLFLSLAQLFHKKDIIISIPFSHRLEPGTERMLGNLLDRLPIRL